MYTLGKPNTWRGVVLANVRYIPISGRRWSAVKPCCKKTLGNIVHDGQRLVFEPSGVPLSVTDCKSVALQMVSYCKECHNPCCEKSGKKCPELDPCCGKEATK